MKLIFAKDDEHQVTVSQEKDGQVETFSYVDMIRELLDEGALDPAELNGDFTEPERISINRMVGFLNGAIKTEEEDVSDI